MVAPALGVVVDTISRGTAATPHELAVAVGRLGAVYIISNCSLAVQVRAGQVTLVMVCATGYQHRCQGSKATHTPAAAEPMSSLRTRGHPPGGAVASPGRVDGPPPALPPV